MEECGFRPIIADEHICSLVEQLGVEGNIDKIENWLYEHNVKHLGFSYRLDPQDGFNLFTKLIYQLGKRGLLVENGGQIDSLFFGGLPSACNLVKNDYGIRVCVFEGDETPVETLNKIGVPKFLIPDYLIEDIKYDNNRFQFGQEVIRSGDFLKFKPVDRSSYSEFGTNKDTLVARLNHSIDNKLPPLIRAHIGPYLSDKHESLKLFIDWIKQLSSAGLMDILSVGTSQLSQSNFGENWKDKPNGGGVPVNSVEDFNKIWIAARPMLVRTYSGTNNIIKMAEMYESSINIAWHALSLWWFNSIDSRGPLSLDENLIQHCEAIKYIASMDKPFEANVSHHFSFRGADDITYILSAFIAAKTAKKLGIRYYILQNMLNTPKNTWGIQDLAKSRALLTLLMELEDDNFKVILQPRAGLDYFSHNIGKAKIQLASVTALMEDIDPFNKFSPPLIHVVGYSEGSYLADPEVVNESIQITQYALQKYRYLKSRGLVENINDNTEVRQRSAFLIQDTKILIKSIEKSVNNPYSPKGLYQIFKAGFFSVPFLWGQREEFPEATKWKTKSHKGATIIIDGNGQPISTGERALICSEIARKQASII